MRDRIVVCLVLLVGGLAMGSLLSVGHRSCDTQGGIVSVMGRCR